MRINIEAIFESIIIISCPAQHSQKESTKAVHWVEVQITDLRTRRMIVEKRIDINATPLNGTVYHTIVGLTPDTPYELCSYAVDDMFRRSDVEIEAFTTIPTVSLHRLCHVGSDFATLSWVRGPTALDADQYPEHSKHLHLFRYEIELYQHSTLEKSTSAVTPSERIRVVDVEDTVHLFSDLSPDTLYSIRVRSRPRSDGPEAAVMPNSSCWGAWSPEVGFQTKNVFDVKAISRGVSRFTIQWARAPGTFHGRRPFKVLEPAPFSTDQIRTFRIRVMAHADENKESLDHLRDDIARTRETVDQEEADLARMLETFDTMSAFEKGMYEVRKNFVDREKVRVEELEQRISSEVLVDMEMELAASLKTSTYVYIVRRLIPSTTYRVVITACRDDGAFHTVSEDVLVHTLDGRAESSDDDDDGMDEILTSADVHRQLKTAELKDLNVCPFVTIDGVSEDNVDISWSIVDPLEELKLMMAEEPSREQLDRLDAYRETMTLLREYKISRDYKVSVRKVEPGEDLKNWPSHTTDAFERVTALPSHSFFGSFRRESFSSFVQNERESVFRTRAFSYTIGDLEPNQAYVIAMSVFNTNKASWQPFSKVTKFWTHHVPQVQMCTFGDKPSNETPVTLTFQRGLLLEQEIAAPSLPLPNFSFVAVRDARVVVEICDPIDVSQEPVLNHYTVDEWDDIRVTLLPNTVVQVRMRIDRADIDSTDPLNVSHSGVEEEVVGGSEPDETNNRYIEGRWSQPVFVTTRSVMLDVIDVAEHGVAVKWTHPEPEPLCHNSTAVLSAQSVTSDKVIAGFFLTDDMPSQYNFTGLPFDQYRLTLVVARFWGTSQSAAFKEVEAFWKEDALAVALVRKFDFLIARIADTEIEYLCLQGKTITQPLHLHPTSPMKRQNDCLDALQLALVTADNAIQHNEILLFDMRVFELKYDAGTLARVTSSPNFVETHTPIQKIALKPEGRLRHTLDGLVAGHTYTVVMRPRICSGRGRDYWGPWSEPVTFTTVGEISLQVTSVTEARVDVSWSRTMNPHSYVGPYMDFIYSAAKTTQLQVRLTPEEGQPAVFFVAPMQRQHTFSDLQSGTRYLVKVGSESLWSPCLAVRTFYPISVHILWLTETRCRFQLQRQPPLVGDDCPQEDDDKTKVTPVAPMRDSMVCLQLEVVEACAPNSTFIFEPPSPRIGQGVDCAEYYRSLMNASAPMEWYEAHGALTPVPFCTHHADNIDLDEHHPVQPGVFVFNIQPTRGVMELETCGMRPDTAYSFTVRSRQAQDSKSTQFTVPLVVRTLPELMVEVEHVGERKVSLVWNRQMQEDAEKTYFPEDASYELTVEGFFQLGFAVPIRGNHGVQYDRGTTPFTMQRYTVTTHDSSVLIPGLLPNSAYVAIVRSKFPHVTGGWSKVSPAVHFCTTAPVIVQLVFVGSTYIVVKCKRKDLSDEVKAVMRRFNMLFDTSTAFPTFVPIISDDEEGSKAPSIVDVESAGSQDLDGLIEEHPEEGETRQTVQDDERLVTADGLDVRFIAHAQSSSEPPTDISMNTHDYDVFPVRELSDDTFLVSGLDPGSQCVVFGRAELRIMNSESGALQNGDISDPFTFHTLAYPTYSLVEAQERYVVLNVVLPPKPSDDVGAISSYQLQVSGDSDLPIAEVDAAGMSTILVAFKKLRPNSSYHIQARGRVTLPTIQRRSVFVDFAVEMSDEDDAEKPERPAEWEPWSPSIEFTTAPTPPVIPVMYESTPSMLAFSWERTTGDEDEDLASTAGGVAGQKDNNLFDDDEGPDDIFFTFDMPVHEAPHVSMERQSFRIEIAEKISAAPSSDADIDFVVTPFQCLGTIPRPFARMEVPARAKSESYVFRMSTLVRNPCGDVLMSSRRTMPFTFPTESALEAPQHVRVINIRHDACTVVWDPPEGHERHNQVRYTVLLHQLRSDEPLQEVRTVTGSFCELTHLMIDTLYRVGIRATSTFGTSARSTLIRFNTSKSVDFSRNLPTTDHDAEASTEVPREVLARYPYPLPVEMDATPPSCETPFHNCPNEYQNVVRLQIAQRELTLRVPLIPKPPKPKAAPPSAQSTGAKQRPGRGHRATTRSGTDVAADKSLADAVATRKEGVKSLRVKSKPRRYQ